MKVCPQCSFSNEERYPTCIWCHALLSDVPATPSADPTHPEHEQKALLKKRQAVADQQIRVAVTGYVLSIIFTAIVPGLVFAPSVLALYLATALIVAWAVLRGFAGQFSASVWQGILSLVVIYYFSPMQPLIFFMLVGHMIFPAVFWHCVELIHAANR